MIVEDEVKAEVIEFSIQGASTIEDCTDLTFYIQYKNKLNEIGKDILINAYPEEIIHNDMVVLDWYPSALFSKEKGKTDIQIFGTKIDKIITSDSVYKAEKNYYTKIGNTFIPIVVYTDTDPSHTPKAGDSIVGIVYEDVVDIRWSTLKATLILPENICDEGIEIYTKAQVQDIVKQLNQQLDIAKEYADESSLFSRGKKVNGEDAEEGDVGYHDNAKYYKEQAQQSASNASTYASTATSKANEASGSATSARESANTATTKANEAGTSATIADNARILSITEQTSQEDSGINTITITYKDGTTKQFTIRNGSKGSDGLTTSITMNGVRKTQIGGNIDLGTIITTLAGYRPSSEQDDIDDALDERLNDIEEVLPNEASSSNKLADKDFVNSSIATETAHYISNQGEPFTRAVDLPTSGVTNNDYAFVTGTDSEGNTYYDRYKASVSGASVTWAKEFRLNNSSFTAVQWSAINSGITALLVQSYNTHISNDSIHVTSQDKTNWNSKGSYSKPSGGIPSSDMSNSVQESLEKADTVAQQYLKNATISSDEETLTITKEDGTTIQFNSSASAVKYILDNNTVKLKITY